MNFSKTIFKKADRLVSYPLSLLLLIAGIFLGNDHNLAPGKVVGLGDQAKGSELPYKTDKSEPEYMIRGIFYQTFSHINNIKIEADDCLTELKINGRTVELPQVPYCKWPDPIYLGSPEGLTLGANLFEAKVKNKIGASYFDIYCSLPENLKSIRLILIFIGSFLLASRIATTFWKDRYISYCFGLGTSLRTLYYLTTKYWYSPHEVEAHLEYIRYILENHGTPPSSGGWQFHQPPLYYWLNAALIKIFSVPDKYLGEFCLFITLIISVLTLWIGLEAIRHIAKHLKAKPFLVAMLMATFPGLIITTIRVNNDSLVIMAGTVFLWSISMWWIYKKDYWLSIASLSIAAGILSKMNALTLVPALIGTILCCRQMTLRQRFVLIARHSLIILIITGTFVLIRYQIDNGISLITKPGNFGLSADLYIDESYKNFLIFNPIEIIKYPWSSPWNDHERRWAFWEYLFKSAYFGELKVPDHIMLHAKILLAMAILVMTIPLFNLANYTATVPVLFTLIFGLAGCLYFRIKIPVSCAQDFRYLAPQVVSIFILMLVSAKQQKYWLKLSSLACLVLILLQTALIIRLSVWYSLK